MSESINQHHPLNRLLAEVRRGPMPELGLHEVGRDAYFAWPCLNASLLKHAAKSPAHFRTALREPSEPTEALRFGTFAHAGQLEPLALVERYAVMPDLTQGIDAKVPKATKEYKQRRAEWEAQHKDKEIVEQTWLDRVIAMARALAANERAADVLGSRGQAEIALVWDDATGVRCKALVDKLSPGRIVDYKTTRGAADFERQIVSFGYDVQGAFYVDGALAVLGEPPEFWLVAQEKEPPYSVRAAPMSEMNLICGRRRYRDALDRVLTAVATDRWPSLDNPDVWERPAWATPEIELCIRGELVTL